MKIKKRKNLKKKRIPTEGKFVIDEAKGLVFDSEEGLLKYFEKEVDLLEKEYLKARLATDLSDKDHDKFTNELDFTIDQPDSVWYDEKTFAELPIYHFHRKFTRDGESYHYVASTYVDDENPTFVFLHFATKEEALSKRFQRTELVYDKKYDAYQAAFVEGDALKEGDLLALGLFDAMMKVRSDKDIPLEQFTEFADIREDAIENADEIWRSTDFEGRSLVTFIKEANDDEGPKDLRYIVVTQEDPGTNVHSLLFSFPTVDENLVERYRYGENLQADEVTQESSH